MSVLINGMDMPTACIECRFCSPFACDVSGEYIKDYYKRNEDCPLVEVKEPHGRLGDLDALKAEWKHGVGDNNYEKAWIATVRRSINVMPTIIEAEGKDDGLQNP